MNNGEYDLISSQEEANEVLPIGQTFIVTNYEDKEDEKTGYSLIPMQVTYVEYPFLFCEFMAKTQPRNMLGQRLGPVVEQKEKVLLDLREVNIMIPSDKYVEFYNETVNQRIMNANGPQEEQAIDNFDELSEKEF